MSVQAMSWVIDHSAHKGGDLLCLIMIANRADENGRSAWPSMARLAEDCRLSRRQIINIIAKLEASKAILIERGKGRHGTNMMAVNMGAGAPIKAKNGEIISPLASEKISPKEGGEKISLVKPTSPPLVKPTSPKPSLEPSLALTTPVDRGPRANGAITPAQNAKVQAVLDELTSREMPTILGGPDKTAIIDSDADPGLIAEAYTALIAREWGDNWLWTNASVANATRQINKFLTRRSSPPPPDENAQAYLDRRMREVANGLTDAERTRLLSGS